MFLEVENPNLSWSKAIPHPGGYKLRTWRRRALVWAHSASQLATILASRKTWSILISHSLRHISWILVTILATGCEGRHPWRIKCATWSESHSVIGCFTATSLIFSGDFTGIFFWIVSCAGDKVVLPTDLKLKVDIFFRLAHSFVHDMVMLDRNESGFCFFWILMWIELIYLTSHYYLFVCMIEFLSKVHFFFKRHEWGGRWGISGFVDNCI